MTDAAKGDSDHPSSVAVSSDAPPPKKVAPPIAPSNFTASVTKPPSKKGKICITLPTQKPTLEPEIKVVPVSSVVKKVFDADEESEEEEMPLEARIKMRNKGREPLFCIPSCPHFCTLPESIAVSYRINSEIHLSYYERQ
ncbi:hypothetical protein SprV_0602103700 [Sparganum proliferum]